MNKLYIIFFIFIFYTLPNDINTLKCDVKLSDKGLTDLTFASIFKSHSDDIDNLLLWTHFFFNHFSYDIYIAWYLENFNIKSIDLVKNKCFKRGLTIFLIYFHSTKLMLYKQDKEKIHDLYNFYKNVDRELMDDFFQSIKSPKILNIIDTIIIPIDKFMHFKIRTFQITDKLNFYKKNTEDIYSIYEECNKKIKEEPTDINHYDMLIMNSGYMYIANLRNLNTRSDLTLSSTGLTKYMKKSTKLLFRNRSKTFELDDTKINDNIFGMCTFDSKTKYYYQSPDDLVSSFFSMIKKKMILGYERFLKEFDNAVIKKNYKLERLKGLRYIKYFFRKDSFNHFAKIHLDLILTENKFLTKDFSNLFNITMGCYYNVGLFNASGAYFYLLKSIER